MMRIFALFRLRKKQRIAPWGLRPWVRQPEPKKPKPTPIYDVTHKKRKSRTSQHF